MYRLIKTTERQQIIDEFLGRLDSVSVIPISLTICKRNDLYCVEVVEVTDEEGVAVEGIT